MLTVRGVVSEFMDGDAIAGAQVEVTVKLEVLFEPPARIEAIRARRGLDDVPMRPVSVPGQVRGTSTTDAGGRYTISVDVAAAIAEIVARRRAEPIGHSALVSGTVECLGLSAKFHRGEAPENGEIDASFSLDFAKTIVGDTGHDYAKLWFCRHGTSVNQSHVCELRETGGNAPDTRLLAVPPLDEHGTATLRVGDLQPGTRYAYRFGVQIDQTTHWLARGSLRTLPVQDRLSFAFSSCHKPIGPDPFDRWRALAGQLDSLDALLLIGDQIYEDRLDAGGPAPASVWERRYAARYHAYWAHRPTRTVVRALPTYMTLDDHEVINNWGPVVHVGQGGDTAARIVGGVAAYRKFQHAHNPGGPESPIHFPLQRGRSSFFFMDSRTGRSGRGPYPIFGAAQWLDVESWARSEATLAADTIFFVAPVPPAFFPIDQIIELGKGVGTTASAAAGAAIGGAIAGPIGAVAGAVIGALVGDAAAGEVIESEQDAYDARDHWTFDTNQPDLDRLLGLLFDLANDTLEGHSGAHKRAVFVLAGDVHVGMVYRIRSKDPRHQANPYIHQLTASPISKPVQMSQSTKVGLGFALDKYRSFTLVGPYSAERMGEASVERNFGRIDVQPVPGFARRVEVTMSLEGETRSQRHPLRFDLDAPIVATHVVAGGETTVPATPGRG